jgi:hypothetical protein
MIGSKHVAALIKAMNEWGSWGDGVPGEGSVGLAYDEAKKWLESDARMTDDDGESVPLDDDGMTVQERAIWTSVLAAAYVSMRANGCERRYSASEAAEMADDAVEDYRRREK